MTYQGVGNYCIEYPFRVFKLVSIPNVKLDLFVHAFFFRQSPGRVNEYRTLVYTHGSPIEIGPAGQSPNNYPGATAHFQDSCRLWQF